VEQVGAVALEERGHLGICVPDLGGQHDPAGQQEIGVIKLDPEPPDPTGVAAATVPG
jgi:hypothetical protein